MNGISVILCCRNSAARLPETLKHIALQKLPKNIPVEVIVVDNGSTDDTAVTAKGVWDDLGTPFELRVSEEPQPGIVFARMKGFTEARYAILVFCDDDNHLSENYLSIAWKEISQQPRIGALGGRGIPKSNQPLPVWFSKYQSGYACGEQWMERGICTSRMYLWGAGLVTRKTLVEKAYDTNYPLLFTGHQEGMVQAGDDMELCKRIILLGYELAFDDRLIYHHHLPPERLTLDYLKKLNLGAEVAIPVQRFYTWQILKKGRSGFGMGFLLLWHMIRYLVFMTGSNHQAKTPILNPLKVYAQGIRKSGRYHQEYKQIQAFARHARTLL